MARTLLIQFKLNRHTSAEWAARTEIPLDGEPCWATDTRVLKIGDGANTWNALPAANAGVTDHGALTGLADNDHPQYAFATTLPPVILSAFVPLIPVYAPGAFYVIKQFSLSDYYSGPRCRIEKIIPFVRGVCDKALTVRVTVTGIGVADKVYDASVPAMAATGSLSVDEALTIASHNVVTVAARMDSEPMEPPADVSVDIITSYEP